MIILFYLSSGLFLGWSLGANDAANIFGTAVGTKMLKFKTAAIIGSIFVILGAVIQGAGASHTLGKLGNVSTLAAAFTVAFSAAITVFWMTRMRLPVSTSQAIVGAIIGWNLYTNNPTDGATLTKIVSTWISGPILGGIFAVLLFMLIQLLSKKTKIHILYRDILIKYMLIFVGAFGAYSLGANNIANVMGVFTGAIELPVIDLGIISFSSTQQLFFIGSIAIALGITTYSKHVMETVGNTLMPLSSEAAIVVVLSQALVLFIFSSQGLSNAIQSIGLPAIPLVPVSSSQIVIGSIIGIGLYKGGKQIKYNILGSISLGWLATPLAAGVLSFFMLFFVNNVFKQDVGGINNFIKVRTQTVTEEITPNDSIKFHENIKDTASVQVIIPNKINKVHNTNENYFFQIMWMALLTLVLLASLLFYLLKRQKKKSSYLTLAVKDNKNDLTLIIDNLEKRLQEKVSYQFSLSKELKFRQSEMITMAMSIIRKNEFLESLKREILKIKSKVDDQDTRLGLNKLSLMITQDLSIDRDRERFQLLINEQSNNFNQRLSEVYPGLTDNEKRLVALLRLNLSSKEIASILNISPKSVEMNRYRLRKKLKVNPKTSLSDFIKDF